MNAVGGGRLKKEIQLGELEKELPEKISTRSTHTALYLTKSEDSPTITLFSSGKYSIAGAQSVNQLLRFNEEFLETIANTTGWSIVPESEFEIRYLVGIGKLEDTVCLLDILDELPADKVEYEPEQFPGLFYRPSETTTIIIFSTGKVSVNGPCSEESLRQEFSRLQEKI